MTGKPYLVIGGGLAGLSAAVELASRGHSVTLLEQARRLGGRAQTETRDGYCFNLGPHALYRHGLAHRALRNWGVNVSGRAPQVKSNSFVVVDGELHPFPADALRLFSTSAFRGWEKFAAARTFQALMRNASPSKTAQEWIEEKTSPGRARLLAESLLRLSTYATDLSRLSAQAALAQFHMAIKSGVLYLDGGWQTLVDGLAAKAQSLGVRIETSAVVSGINYAEYTGVILAVPPRAVESLTGKTLPPLIPTHMATLDIAMKGLPEKPSVFALGLDQPFYFSRHSAAARLAPASGEVVHVAKYLGEAGVCERRELEAFATLVMPGWQEHTVDTRFLPNLTVSHALWTLAGRPAVDALGIPGVAIAGDWVGDEGMLADAAVASGICAAESVSGASKAMAA